MQALVETTEYTVIMCLETCKTNDPDYKHMLMNGSNIRTILSMLFKSIYKN